MSKLRDKIIDQIIVVEGGYVNDPSDSGGETKYGITVTVARANGYKGDMKDLPIELAKNIYVKKYWDSLSLDKIAVLSELIAEELADTAVNMGVERAGKFIQEALNALNNRGQSYADLTVDGAVGNKTIIALETFLRIRKKDNGERVLFNILNCLQGAFYIELSKKREKDEEFVFGWFKNRVTIKES